MLVYQVVCMFLFTLTIWVWILHKRTVFSETFVFWKKENKNKKRPGMVHLKPSFSTAEVYHFHTQLRQFCFLYHLTWRSEQWVKLSRIFKALNYAIWVETFQLPRLELTARRLPMLHVTTIQPASLIWFWSLKGPFLLTSDWKKKLTFIFSNIGKPLAVLFNLLHSECFIFICSPSKALLWL